jgi:putative transposase
MARGPRLDAAGTMHHVIVRGIERGEIFRGKRDREDFLARLGRIVEEGQATCFAWVLIPNHVHLLLRTGEAPLARLMRRLLTGYAVSFNLRHQRSGHLFQNRYKSIVCEEEAYLLELIRYIHLNCIRAGLVKDMHALDRYRWSGHSVLMGYEDRPWQAKDEVLSYFGRRQGAAKKKYRQFVSEGISLGRRQDLIGGVQRLTRGERDGDARRRWDNRILGSEAFIERLLAEEEGIIHERDLLKRRRINVEELLHFIGQQFGVTKEEIQGGSQRRVVARARSVFCYVGTRRLGLTGIELSQVLGLTPAAINYAVARGENLLRENKEVKEGMTKYLKNLTTSP